MAEQELGIIRQAVLNETEGKEFYLAAASRTEDKEVQQAFRQLAAEEQAHIQWLLDLRDSIVAGKGDNYDIAVDGPPVARIFNWQTFGRESGSLVVSVFGIAIQLEKAAIDFYKQAAEKTKLAGAKKLYAKLVEWEYEHLRQFERDYDQLRDEWWEKQGFTPS